MITATKTSSFSPLTCSLYMFNLIVGTGTLALPAAFAGAGWTLSSFLLSLLALLSFMTAGWVVEAMAACNAILKMESKKKTDNETAHLDAVNRIEESPLVSSDEDVFSLSRQLELTSMSEMLYNKAGKVALSVCIVVYLYGDLAIYCVAVAKSLRDVTCSFSYNNSSCSIANMSLTQPCLSSSQITRAGAYRIYVGVFFLLLGPFTFLNLSKTKYLQVATTLLRWIAFTAMITLSVIKILDPSSAPGTPPLAEWSAIPALFGTSVYAFMCHHSLPGMVTPMSDKSNITTVMASVYVITAIFYFILAFTGIFAFPQVQDLYTLMFRPCSTSLSPTLITEYFLALFPVFTLSTNFPIIAITLRKNLEELTSSLPSFSSLPPLARQTVFPLLAIVPPTLVAVITEDLGALVTITGAYAGAGIQYVIPCSLVWLARRRIAVLQTASQQPVQNPLASPFRNVRWLLLVLAWTCLAIVLVTVNLLFKIF